MNTHRVIRVISSCLSRPIGSDIEMWELLNEGLPVEIIEKLVEQDILQQEDLPELTNRTKSSATLSTSDSDLIARLVLLDDFAVEVFTDPFRARKWLRTKNAVLNNLTPVNVMRTGYGAILVEQTLGRIAHGIYS
ncbi:MAG TPA: antitoxin Xre/MbcA/ParS toxin-binding domain-containing protein [Planktothrix sp.]